jgi:acyl-coenzyme A thioesterase PaaI-like protein
MGDASATASLPLPLETRVRQLMDAKGAPPSAEALRAVGALRELMRWCVTAETDDSNWSRVADRLEALRAALPPAGSTRYVGAGAVRGEIAARSGFSPNVRGTHPLVGRASPVAPPIELWVEGERAYGDVCFGPTYEGVPGCAHGGYIAAGFDIVLGQAAWLNRQGGGVTGTLTVRYRSLTPIGVALRYESWLVRSGGRTTQVAGRLCTLPAAGSSEEPRVCAEAEGVFVSIEKRAPAGAVEGG